MFFLTYILPSLVCLAVLIIPLLGLGNLFDSQPARQGTAFLVIGLAMGVVLPLYVQVYGFHLPEYWIVAFIFWGGCTTSLAMFTFFAGRQNSLASGLVLLSISVTIQYLVDHYSTPSWWTDTLRLLIFTLLVGAVIGFLIFLFFKESQQETKPQGIRANTNASSQKEKKDREPKENRAVAWLGIAATLVGLISTLIDVLGKLGLWPLGHG